MYQQLGLDKLRPSKITLQLADRSVKKAMEEIEDVLINIREFMFPVNFIVSEIQLVTNPQHHILVIME